MMFLWKNDMIRFMKDASEYGNYNKIIAGEIIQYMNEGMDICEIGCGLGYLSLELSHYVNSVTSIDINEDAVSILKENCKKNKIENIRAVCADAKEVLPKPQTGKSYDALISCMFGSIEETVEIAKREAISRVHIVFSLDKSHSFSVGGESREKGYENGITFLDDNKIEYEFRKMSLEFGQPLRNIGDAKKFLETYNRDDNKSISEDYIMSRVIKNDSGEYPYYIPMKRERGFLNIYL